MTNRQAALLLDRLSMTAGLVMTSLGSELSVMCVQGYQRLEFLGDAVLDLLMTRYYFTTYR